MNTLVNNFDSLEKLIYEEGICIKAVDIHKDLDLMLIILNTKTILKRNISSYKKLKTASEEKLNNYKLIGKGTGIHWPKLDEDLSLKGFLREEIQLSVGHAKKAKAA
jgi:hypothetical protein